MKSVGGYTGCFSIILVNTYDNQLLESLGLPVHDWSVQMRLVLCEEAHHVGNMRQSFTGELKLIHGQEANRGRAGSHNPLG